MKKSEDRPDKHFPNIAFTNPLRKFLNPPERLFGPYLKNGDMVADLGCGPGYYTIPMARIVSPTGIVYAVDSYEKCLHAIEKKSRKMKINNIRTYATSAHVLNFIEDGSIDFILANGLLCSMAPQNHLSAVKEIIRILKPEGLAYLSVAKGSMSYVDKDEWEELLEEFKIIEHGDKDKSSGDRWALVTIKSKGKK